MTEPLPDSTCRHLSVRATVRVERLPDPDPATIRWQAVVDVQCADWRCDAKLGWVGVPAGPDPGGPSTSDGGFALTVPLAAPPSPTRTPEPGGIPDGRPRVGRARRTALGPIPAPAGEFVHRSSEREVAPAPAAEPTPGGAA